MVAPTVDPQTRNGLVYVDLPRAGRRPRAGMFARGEFELGARSALTLPQSAVLLRDGFSYVLRVGADNQGRADQGRRSAAASATASRSPAGSTPTRASSPRAAASSTTATSCAWSTVPLDGATAPRRRRRDADQRRHDQRLRLVDPQPDPGGAAVHHADARRR